MKATIPLLLSALALVLTGCPHNDYTIELKPEGDRMERRLIFHAADGSTGNASTNGQTFSQTELSAILSAYHSPSVTTEGGTNIVAGTFAGAMPGEFGGAGYFTNVQTSLGSAGYYSERFRGSDDRARVVERRIKDADQLTEWLLGWSKATLGHEKNYKDLRQFIDVNLRHDLKNLSFYSAPLFDSAHFGNSDNHEEEDKSQEKEMEEVAVRFGQYLLERGYIRVTDLPVLFQINSLNDDNALLRLVERLVMEKLGIPESQPPPADLQFLSTTGSIEKSWESYLATTKFYGNKMHKWMDLKKSKPDLQPPKATDMAGELIFDLVGLNSEAFLSTDDNLLVELLLNSPPDHTNGRWDAANGEVEWTSTMENATNSSRWPAFCYAAWSTPDGDFQTNHFGKVILVGDPLQQYCLWRAGLTAKRAGEWDAWIAGLSAADDPRKKLAAFRFSDQPPTSGTNAVAKTVARLEFGVNILTTAMQEKSGTGADRK